MIAAGLLARKAVEAGLQCRPWVKTSLAPGSRVVTQYLDKAGLTPYLEKLGFNLVGYGCTTCIGNSGPLPEEIAEVVDEQRPGGGCSSVGQSKFRGTHSRPGEGELPGVAAVVCRVRAGRNGHVRLDRGSAWGPIETASPST